MSDVYDWADDEHRAELEDRAAELVDRDWLLGQEWQDRAEARAEQQAHDRALFAARDAEDARIDGQQGPRLYQHDQRSDR